MDSLNKHRKQPVRLLADCVYHVRSLCGAPYMCEQGGRRENSVTEPVYALLNKTLNRVKVLVWRLRIGYSDLPAHFRVLLVLELLH